jgi:hypothetical protein
MLRTIGIILIMLMGSTGLTWAEQAPKTQEQTVAEVQAVQAARTKSIKKFAAAEERSEALRYRHLWIAYGMIWLIVFVFVFRTWKMNQSTTSELQALKRRIAKLETSDES